MHAALRPTIRLVVRGTWPLLRSVSPTLS